MKGTIRGLLSAVPKTQPPRVVPLRNWDRMEEAVHAACNYRVIAEAEVAKCETALDHARSSLAEALALEAEAKAAFSTAARTLLGINVEATTA